MWWPFARKEKSKREKDILVIPNHLGEKPPADPAPPDPAVALNRELNASEAEIGPITPLQTLFVPSLISSTQRVSAWIEAISRDLTVPGGDLDRFGGDIDSAYERMKNTVGQSPDVVLRKLAAGKKTQWPALIAYIDGLADSNLIERDVLWLMEQFDATLPVAEPAQVYQTVKDSLNAVGHVSTETQWDKLMIKLTSGNTLLFLAGSSNVLVLDAKKLPSRSLTTSQSEPTIVGPQVAFNEVIMTQMNLLRMEIKSPGLRFSAKTVGSRTQTQVVVSFLEGVTNPALVSAVFDRIGQIHRDHVFSANDLAEYMIDRRWTIFPQTRKTDRVDWVAHGISQGKVAILVENDPYAILLPNTLMDYYQTTQDYATSFWDATLTRIIRMIGLFIALFLLPFYIALTSVNTDLIPTKLLLTVAGSRVGIPFPPVTEVVIMWTVIEILREAANRLPQQMATTIGTVGAVVVGTAIVKAGVVDSLMIVTVTLTALGYFTSPVFEITATWRWLFWLFIGASYVFGVYGIVLLAIVVVAHLTSLENFGTPYFTPFGPVRVTDLGDTWIRMPTPALNTRPVSTRPIDVVQSGQREQTGFVDLYSSQQEARE